MFQLKLIILLVSLYSISPSLLEWRKEMTKSLNANVVGCKWSEVSLPALTEHHTYGPRALDVVNISQTLSEGSFSVVQMVPREKDVEQFRKLPSTLTKAHKGFATAASKRGYDYEKWVKPGQSSWQIPDDHPGQDRAMCLNYIKAASTGKVLALYDGLKKIERVSYVMRAEDAYIYSTGAVALNCGYFSGTDGCETRWNHVKEYYDKCAGFLKQHDLPWKTLFKATKSDPHYLELFEACKETSELTIYHNISAVPVQYEKVFVATALWDFNYHHFLADSVARTITSIRYLRNNPDIKIHIRSFEVYDMQGNSGSTFNSSAAAAPSSSADLLQDDFTANMGNIGVLGLSQVRILDPNEGAVLCVNHFNSDVASLVTYATQRGGLHGWDLRAAKEAMHLPLRPELGYATSMTISPDRNWICMGTSKGFVSLFDIRYNVPSKLWRHSSHSAIHRLACCKAPKAASNAGASAGMPQSEGAFLFVAAGNNEAAVWGIPEGGECCKCFRSVSLDASRGPVAPLPFLEDINLPRRPHAPIRFQDSVQTYSNPRDDSVKAIIGRISQSNQSYLVTAGTDRSIRFWDFAAPNRCFTISGLEAAQPKAIFDAPKLSDGSSGKLFVCYVAATPSVDKILQMHLPAREGRGIVLPSANAKDAILDLKNIDLPMKLMLSSNRDGEIKLWR